MTDAEAARIRWCSTPFCFFLDRWTARATNERLQTWEPLKHCTWAQPVAFSGFMTFHVVSILYTDSLHCRLLKWSTLGDHSHSFLAWFESNQPSMVGTYSFYSLDETFGDCVDSVSYHDLRGEFCYILLKCHSKLCPTRPETSAIYFSSVKGSNGTESRPQGPGKLRKRKVWQGHSCFVTGYS